MNRQPLIFSHAKLLLLGEYAVLHGAWALCLPLRTGQSLYWDVDDSRIIRWQWQYNDEPLCHWDCHAQTLEVLQTYAGDASWGVSLINIIREHAPDFLKSGGNLLFVNHFPPQWGWGSSSATISSLSRLAEVNPYVVNQEHMGGSGADIACTIALRWFLYQRNMPWPVIKNLQDEYLFAEKTFFVYSGKKQDTALHIKEIAEKQTPKMWLDVNPLVESFVHENQLQNAITLVQQHEALISQKTGLSSLALEFPDFKGAIKSLGAWGGDFFMVITPENEEYVVRFFTEKGYDKVFSWNTLVNSAKF